MRTADHPRPCQARMALAVARTQKRVATGNNPLPESELHDLANVVVDEVVRRGRSVREVAIKYEVSGKAVRDILLESRVPSGLIAGRYQERFTHV